MRLGTGAWSNGNGNEGSSSPRLSCPNCGAALAQAAMAAGQRLARCRQCGQMLRRPFRRTWPTSPAAGRESASTAFAWTDTSAFVPTPPEAGDYLETGPNYPPPALQCPYCEHLNQDNPRMGAGQFCGNCGAHLKKTCLNCDAPMYILDHFCTRCRSDQERVKYEVEGMYWQRFNEGKRLAGLGRWQDAERELSLFFEPDPNLDREQIRQARQIYISSIAPFDGGEGLRLYNEARAALRDEEEAYERRLARRRNQRWIVLAALPVLLAVLSALTFGSWWAIFVIVPVVGVALALLILFVLANIGLG